MKTSTIWDKRWVRIAAAAAFWLAAWQGVSMAIPKLLFAGPVPTVQSLLSMLPTAAFWASVAGTVGKIAAGFAAAFAAGGILAALCSWSKACRAILEPAVHMMKSLPVACFVVVALIWVPSAWISVLTAYFVVFPAVYINLRTGISGANRKMLEMARVFRLSAAKRARVVWIPAVLPYLLSACRVTVGMALKAGIAGEIIGLPRHSIGEQLYLAKLYLNTDDLFAWSIAIIGLSFVLEKLLVHAIAAAQRKWGAPA